MPARTPPAALGARTDLRKAWISAGICAVLGLAALVGLFWDTAATAVEVWIGSKTYNHCFLIVPIVAYLLWDRRELFSQVAPRPTWAGLLLLPVFGLFWLIAEMASVQEGRHIALALMFEAVLLTVLGWRAFWAFLFPFLYLLFLVPSGEFLVPMLQDFTADFSVLMLRMVGIPTFRDGIFISIPNGHFEVAEACAGIRFLIASIAFGFLFANLVYRTYPRRLFFIALSIVVPVIANGFRAFGIIILAHFSDNTIAVGADHLVYGWFFFALIMLLLIWIGGRLRSPEDEGPPEAPAISRGGRPARAGVFALAVVATSLTAAATPATAAWLASRPAADAPELVAAPPAPPGWSLVESDSGWLPEFPNADRILRQTYESPKGRVELFLAYYSRQSQDGKVIAHFNNLYDGQRWVRAGSSAQTAKVDGRPQPVAGTRLLGAGRERRLVLSWYWVDGTFTASGLKAKLLQAKAELLTRRRAAAAIAIAAEYDELPEDALRLIDEFLAAAEPLEPMLARAAKR